jgi:hypothetical protein
LACRGTTGGGSGLAPGWLESQREFRRAGPADNQATSAEAFICGSLAQAWINTSATKLHHSRSGGKIKRQPEPE